MSEQESKRVRISPKNADWIKSNNTNADNVISLYSAMSEAVNKCDFIDVKIKPEDIISAYIERCAEAGCDIIEHDTTGSFLFLLHSVIDITANVFSILNRAGSAGIAAIEEAKQARDESIKLLFGDKLSTMPSQQFSVMRNVFYSYFMLQFFICSVLPDNASEVLITDGNDRYEVLLNELMTSLDTSERDEELKKQLSDQAAKMKKIAAESAAKIKKTDVEKS